MRNLQKNSLCLEWHSIKEGERPRSETATPSVGWECLAEVTPPCPRIHFAKLADGLQASKATRTSREVERSSRCVFATAFAPDLPNLLLGGESAP